MTTRLTLPCLLAFALVQAHFTAQAQLPTLDPVFATNGAYQVPIQPGAEGAGSGELVVLPSGGYLALGAAAYWDGFGFIVNGVAQKLDACGTPDPTFGVNGLQQYNGGGSWRVSPSHGTELADGSLFLVGTTSTGWGAVSTNRHTTMRVLADGTLDANYGTNGLLRHNAPDVSSTYGTDMMVLPDGKILTAAVRSGNISGGSNGFALFRHLTNGELDPDFGVGGALHVSKPEFANVMQTHLTSGNTILVAYGRRFLDTMRMEISAYDLDGALITTFGDNGAVADTTDFFVANGVSKDFSSVLDAQGRLTILGGNAQADIQLIRFLPNGARDASYGVNGRVLVPYLGTNLMPVAGNLKLLANGDLLALVYAGTTSNVATTQWVRLTADGEVLSSSDQPWLTFGFVQASDAVEIEEGRWLVNAASLFPFGVAVRRFSMEPGSLPSIMQDGASLVSAGSGPGFQWLLDGNVINGATANTFTPTTNGTYTVEMTDALGCTAMSEPFQLLNVGVQALDPASAIVVAGPDAYGMLTVRGEGAIAYELLDARGLRLKTGNMASGFGQIASTELATGTYVLVLRSAKGRQVFRFFAE